MAESHRAPRIPDSEWNRCRATIEHLYVDQDLSREEVIKTLASKHGLTVTYVIILFCYNVLIFGAFYSLCKEELKYKPVAALLIIDVLLLAPSLWKRACYPLHYVSLLNYSGQLAP